MLHLCQTDTKKNIAMAASSSASFTSLSLLLVSSLFASSLFCVSEAQPSVPVVKGLSWSFYESSCPNLNSIIRKHLKKVFKEDIGQAAGLLRLHFHDCFVNARYLLFALFICVMLLLLLFE